MFHSVEVFDQTSTTVPRKRSPPELLMKEKDVLGHGVVTKSRYHVYEGNGRRD